MGKIIQKYLYAGLKHGKPIFIISASNIKQATHRLSKYREVYKIEQIKKIGKRTKSGKQGKVINL